MRHIEEKIFRSQKKNIVTELKEEWTGSHEQNSFADSKISDIVKRTLMFD